MRKTIIATAVIGALSTFIAKADEDISGTYKLIIEQRKIVETGETVPVPNPLGYITYGKDGRMLVLIVRHPRPKPEAKSPGHEASPRLRGMSPAFMGENLNSVRIDPVLKPVVEMGQAGARMHVARCNLEETRDRESSKAYQYETDGWVHVCAAHVEAAPP
jgi:hypothetical protein